MADLNVDIARRFGRIPIMPPNPALFVNMDVGETRRLSESVVSRSLTPIFGTPAAEVVRASSNTVSPILDLAGLAEVAYVVDPVDYVNVTSVTGRVRVSGSSTVIATKALGKPAADANNVCIVDMTSALSGLSTGNYTISILLTSPGGSTDSAESAPFSVPL